MSETPHPESEAYTELSAMADRRAGKIPGELLARHILQVTAGGDWPVREAAMQAVLRRSSYGKDDGLTVSERPAGRRPLGIYRTRRKGTSSERPYTTLIAGIDPIHASCDCADYLRNSLGLCKHVLTVLDHLHQRPRLLQQAIKLQAAGQGLEGPALLWDPVRPMVGAGDWLERISYAATGNGQRKRPQRTLPAFAQHFLTNGSGPGVLRTAYAEDPLARHRLIEDLLGSIRPRGRGRRPQLATEPALPPLLDAERRRLHDLSLHALSQTEIARAVASMKQKPYPYQLEGIERFLAAGRLLLADDMGLGKTAQAIGSCHVLAKTGRVERGLLIVPASLKPQWLREWQSFTDVPLVLVEGRADERRTLYRKHKKGFLLTNYEQFLRDFQPATAWKPEIVVLDEAQRIKNWATKSATFIKRLDPRFRLVLTGTPMENRLEELASIYDWVESFALEPKWRLVPAHVTHVDGTKEIDGVRNLDTLRTRLAPTMLRRTRSEVLDQLPSRTDTIVPVDITPVQSEEHDALERPIAALVHIRHRRPLTQGEFLKLMQLLTTQRIIANGMAQYRFLELWPDLSGSAPEPALLASLATPKLLELGELLQHVVVEQGRKVVVFSQWRRMLELARWATHEVLARAGRRAVFFTGAERQKRRTQNLVELHDDPTVAVLFASDAGGVGLNLQKAANCCINMDLPWNPAVLEQRIGRIYRLGQRQPIDVYNLVTQHSIEARIAGLIADKQAMFSNLFDGSSNEVQFERSGSFLVQVERVIEPVEVPGLEDDASFDEEDPVLARELDGMMASADEASDGIAAEPADERPATGAAPATAGAKDAAAVPADVQQLFSQLRIGTTADGGISIEAPPEAAATLASVFEGMAKLLRAQAKA